jgi:hypothetical protein
MDVGGVVVCWQKRHVQSEQESKRCYFTSTKALSVNNFISQPAANPNPQSLQRLLLPDP